MKKQNTSELYAKAIKLCMQSGPENKMKKVSLRNDQLK